MATYFVKTAADGGSDAANGLTAATAKATIASILGATGIMVAGDTAHVAVGVYREVNTITITNPASEVRVLGDVTGQYTLVEPTQAKRRAIVSAFLTDDITAASVTSLFNFNQRDYLTFEDIEFHGGANTNCGGCIIPSVGGTSNNLTFNRCGFVSSSFASAGAARGIDYHVGPDVNTGSVFNDCWFESAAGSGNGSFKVQCVSTAAIADFDCGITLNNCISLGNFAHVSLDGTASTFFGGGVDCNGCAVMNGQGLVTGVSVSATVPSTFVNGWIYSGSVGAALSANALGQITERNNMIYAGTPRTNVTAGVGSVSDGSRLFSIEGFASRNFPLRTFFEPRAGSPFLTFGNNAPPANDMRGIARPYGSGGVLGAIGPLGRINTFTRSATTPDAGTYCYSAGGPAVHEFQVAVAAAATTLTFRVWRDATYTGTSPSMRVLNGSEIGVANATATSVGAALAYETITLTFTPTATGIVTLRIVSSDTNGAGVCKFDTFAGPNVDLAACEYARRGDLPSMLFNATVAAAVSSQNMSVGRLSWR